MHFSSVVRINSIFWITSLHDDEVGVTRRVLEDLEPGCSQRELLFGHFIPSTAAEFLGCLDAIASKASVGMRPIIHLDTHGSADAGIRIAGSGEHVSWADIVDKLRIINRITENNLCVISCACFSFHVVSEIDINETSPFFILIAPEHEIAAGDIEENIIKFYFDMLDNEEIITAHQKWFAENLRLFHCEKMLAIVLAKYVNNSGIGRQRARRKEDLVTKAINSGVANNRTNRRALRKLVDKNLKVDERLIERFLTSFLAGKKPSFSMAQILDMVRTARASGLKAEGPYA
ncbi:hypothetical protein KBW81_12770 [Loktanella salsilacus]|uniref:hypothetical protein n=1 Tax=Loktanella salsilacus TaxID=195913 RepID=UPI0020B71925|nr:hypothetical protein [Loktanella salsilacus]UTH47579.1 hypothetical protein KBW81_12770 [Loktanella salsilacus]